MHVSESEHSPMPVRLYRINAGSCNGCDVEIAATAMVDEFDVTRLGCGYTEAAAEADIVLITGPLTLRSRDQVLRDLGALRDHAVLVSVGICAISGGVFRDSYAVDAPPAERLPVEVNVPGCPPRPQALLAGIREALALLAARRPDLPVAVTPEPRESETAARGRMRFSADACVDCRICRHVCAPGAIRFEDDRDGVTFTIDHNRCVFCGLCAHYCPSGAISATGDWRLAHRANEAGALVERGTIPRGACTGCGETLTPLPPELLRRAFGGTNRDIERLKELCPACRQTASLGGAR